MLLFWGAQPTLNLIVTVAVVVAIWLIAESLRVLPTAAAFADMAACVIAVGGFPFSLSTLMVSSISGAPG